MSPSKAAIPYEKQSEELSGRSCGAACLCIAYRSLGLDVPQAEIWPAIAKANRFGQISSTTHLMARDALNRGLSAVALQARHPLHALKVCSTKGIRAILNHRVKQDSAGGHYTLMVDLDAQHVIVHDPLFGAARRMTHAELVELWLPDPPLMY